ncbi:hypothetical protein [Legionella erythra]|uniref:Uncharacterized protein n=1 Tax=Legionella erythra TaxID=448 RepID=A0A0W0TJG9_LEGER|nr:hypothetical protein [Legionella erythra]KTC95721.1 hypothetical protein Lery_2016 [Legionella erythra]
MSLQTIINQLLEKPFKTDCFTVSVKPLHQPDSGYVLQYEYKNTPLFQLEFIERQAEISDGQKIIPLPFKKLHIKRAIVLQDDFSAVSFPNDLPFRKAFSHLDHHDLRGISQQDRDFSVYNYFCGPKIDDVRYGDSFTISTFGTEEISDELKGTCDKLSVPVHFLALETRAHTPEGLKIEEWLWLRDLFRRLGNGMLLFNDEGLSQSYFAIADSAMELNPRSGKYAFARPMKKSSDADDSASDDEDEAMVFGFETEGSYGSQLSAELDSHKHQLKDLFQQAGIDIKSSQVLLEGGNTYCLTNTKGELLVVLGENSLVLTAAYRKQHGYQNLNYIKELKKHPMPQDDFYFNLEKNNHPIQWHDIEEAKFAIAEESNIHSSQLIILSNPLFHIDMIMTQGPNGIILLHDFQLVEDILEPIREQIQNQRQLHPHDRELKRKEAYLDSVLFQNHKLKETLGGFIVSLTKTLQSHGFKVVPIPALAYQYVLNDDCFDADELDDGPRIVLNLVNGITGQWKSGHFLIALSPANDNLRPLLEVTAKILKENGITLYPVGSPEAASLILNGSGSLRCMSFPNGMSGLPDRLISQLTSPPQHGEPVSRMRRKPLGFGRFRRLDQNPFDLRLMDEMIEQLREVRSKEEARQSFSDAYSLFGEQFLSLWSYPETITNQKRKNTDKMPVESEMATNQPQSKYQFNGRFFIRRHEQLPRVAMQKPEPPKQ